MPGDNQRDDTTKELSKEVGD